MCRYHLLNFLTHLFFSFIPQTTTVYLNVPGTALSTDRHELDQGPVLQVPRASNKSKHKTCDTKHWGEEKRKYSCSGQDKGAESSQRADP